MQYYRCKCGSCESYGSMSPPQCAWCEKCNSNPASRPDLHRSERGLHEWMVENVQTDEGVKPLTVCRWCGILKIKAEAAREE